MKRHTYTKTHRMGVLFMACFLLFLAGCQLPMGTDITECAVPTTHTVPTATTASHTTCFQPEATTEPLPLPQFLLSQMTLEEKAAHLFLVSPEELLQTQPNGASCSATEMSDTLADALADYPVAGIVHFSQNLESPLQILGLNLSMQRESTIPLFLAIDEEGGSVARIGNHPAFSVTTYKSASAVGASEDPEKARQMGLTIGTYLKSYGFNMNLAPVADVNTNPQNKVIGNRAFSSDPYMASVLVGAAADGLRQAGIIPVFKHFPGHGNTSQDSHYELAITNRTAEEMQAGEWLPFLNATDTDGIMMGHIAAPRITGGNIPATLSEIMIQTYLRDTCGFEGLILTDSFVMKAITDTYGTEEAVLMAINAGCNVILLPGNLELAANAVVSAVKNGSLHPETLDACVLRTLAFKEANGLFS